VLGFQVTVISEYSRLVCVGDRKLSCKQQKYIHGDKGRRLHKHSGTAEGLQAHLRTYCKDSARWAIPWNALLYSRDTSPAVAALLSTSISSDSLESPDHPIKAAHLQPRLVSIKCLLMENSTTEQTSHSVQLVLTEEDVDGAKLQEPLENTTRDGGWFAVVSQNLQKNATKATLISR